MGTKRKERMRRNGKERIRGRKQGEEGRMGSGLRVGAKDFFLQDLWRQML